MLIDSPSSAKNADSNLKAVAGVVSRPEGQGLKHAIGIDLGGTKIEGVLLAPDGSVRERRRRATPGAEGYEAIVSATAELIRELDRLAGDHETTVGIGTPGSLSRLDGCLRNSNTTCMNGRPFLKDLEAAVGRPVPIENDANCFALAEALRGAGRGHDLVFGVILGTGVGGGIVNRGRIHTGRLGIGGEWGHQTLVRGGASCYCGRQGCVETCLSGPALEGAWREATGLGARLPDIVERFESGGELPGGAEAWRKEMLELFGIAIANVINLLDPDVVVLGGGVSNVPWLYDEGAERVRANIFSDVRDTPILEHELGDSAGVFGAALLGAGRPS